MARKLSINAQILIKVGGVAVGGSYVEFPLVKDVTLNAEKDQSDVTTRQSGGIKQFVGTLKDFTVEFQARHLPSNTLYAALQTSFFDGTVLGVQIVDEDGYGIQGDFEVMSANRNEALADNIMTDFTLKPTLSDTPIVEIGT